MNDSADLADLTEPVAVVRWSDLEDRKPSAALVANVDLVVTRFDDEVSVLYGRCLHRGALMADGHVDGANLICGLHGWDYRLDTGVSAYDNSERLDPFRAVVFQDEVWVDEAEIRDWACSHPQPYDRDAYLGQYQDPNGTPDEPWVGEIQGLARSGLAGSGHHGPVAAMGVPQHRLPRWDDLQILAAQLSRRPLLDDAPVSTETVIGPAADKPLLLGIPIFVSDMSFGALSEEAKIALAKGAEGAGTGICSGEGGMLPDEQAANSRYFYELASGRFGWSLDKIADVQAFHFKFGQAAKTGVGGHLPGHKVTGRIAEVRGLEAGTDAVSPATFEDLTSPEDYRALADEIRAASGGIPLGAKLSAQHIEDDLDAALDLGVDYVILDGRGGGTGAAPTILRDNLSVPTIPALARARRHLDRLGAEDVTLVVTGGLRTPADFTKALALGADAIAVSNAALQAIGCLGMRACHTNNCPVGIATQRDDLRSRLIIDESAAQLTRFLTSAVELMKVIARACGHERLRDFDRADLTTYDRDMAHLTGVSYGGVIP